MNLIAHYANICLRYIQMIRITDIIDMAIIAYIIYRLLLLTKKSRSGQVLKGIVLVLLAVLVLCGKVYTRAQRVPVPL